MRILRTIILAVLALISVMAAVLLTVDGNLSRLIGRSAFGKGERLFPYTVDEIGGISWMRVDAMHDRAEAYRNERGVWWLSQPWDDRMDPKAAGAILQFTYSTAIVDVLPYNNTIRGAMREFGLETTPVHLTLKTGDPDSRMSTLARYTLGTTAPWLVDDPENETTNETTYLRSDFYGKDKRVLVTTGNILPLFREGIQQLRDHHPFLLPPTTIDLPSQPKQITIYHNGEEITLKRDDFNSQWKITTPLELRTNEEAVKKLLNGLQKLTATKVSDMTADCLPDTKEEDLTQISVTNMAGEEPVVLTIYPADSSLSKTAKAIVSDRKAVFDLPLESAESVPGLNDLPLSLNQLRTQTISSFDRANIRVLSLRSSQSEFPIIIRLKLGDKNTGTKPAWLYSAEGDPFVPVNEEQLYKLLKTLEEEPVQGFATDSPTDLSNYGLDNPYLSLTIGQTAGHPAIFYSFGLGLDGSCYVKQPDKPSVYQISKSFLRAFSSEPLDWKPTKLLNFSRFELQNMIIEQQGQAPLHLSYGHLDDSWEATQEGKDISVLINPNRANRYLAELEKMHVKRWLPYDDITASQAMKRVNFRLRLVLAHEQDVVFEEVDLNGQKTMVPRSQEPIIEEKILEIAPASEEGAPSVYYGKISDSPNFFVLSPEEVKILTASLYEED